MDAERSPVKSADRVLEMLELLGRWGDEITHSEISARLALPKSSTTQLLKVLAARGYVKYLADTKRYRAGPALGSLAEGRAAGPDILRAARPALVEISRRTRESVALNLLDGDSAVVAATVDGDQTLASHMREGDRAPLYATSSGKLFLAFGPGAAMSAYLSRVELEKITPNTVASLAALRHEIARVRDAGIARSFEEFTVGIVGIAIPILDAGGGIAAAINVAVPAARFDAEREALCLNAMRPEVAQIQARVSGRPT